MSKASGLAAALDDLGLSPHNVVGVGDAENDHAFLSVCECAVAVANALPTIKERADVVTKGDAGAGVEELAAELVATDLESWEPALQRHWVLLGQRPLEGGGEVDVRIPPYGSVVLVAGSSGAGKSTLAIGVLERIIDQGYQCCIIDPEGDYATVERAVSIGTPQRAPIDEEVAALLEDPTTSVVVNLLGERIVDRPNAVAKILGRALDLRARVDRPHWLAIDEAHHAAPSSLEPAPALAAAVGGGGALLVTVEPQSLAPALVGAANVVVTVGDHAIETMAEFARVIGESAPVLPPPPTAGDSSDGTWALAWDRRAGEAPFFMRIVPPRAERERHVRKYAEGELAPDRSFYFRGPDGALNLRAQNLLAFNQIAEGVDDRTWVHHLRRGDYSVWLRGAVKDLDLADEIERIERRDDVPPRESRALVREAIERRYTVPV